MLAGSWLKLTERACDGWESVAQHRRQIWEVEEESPREAQVACALQHFFESGRGVDLLDNGAVQLGFGLVSLRN